MLKNLKKQQQGFTIIEVMIVLVIAAVILLIVFLAVPALQRNNRNTQRKNDVATYAAAVNEWMTNSNNGQVPTTAANVTAINDLANSGFLAEPSGVPATGTVTTTVPVGNMTIVTGAKCDTANVGDSTGTGASTTRQFVIRFSVENASGGAVKQCQEG